MYCSCNTAIKLNSSRYVQKTYILYKLMQYYSCDKKAHVWQIFKREHFLNQGPRKYFSPTPAVMKWLARKERRFEVGRKSMEQPWYNGVFASAENRLRQRDDHGKMTVKFLCKKK